VFEQKAIFNNRKQKSRKRSRFLAFTPKAATAFFLQDGSYSRGPLDLLNNVQVDAVNPDDVEDDDPRRRTYNMNPASIIEQVRPLLYVSAGRFLHAIR
jgi:hypothetical protein